MKPTINNSPSPQVTKWVPSSQSPPMFVSMILDPIWQLYDAAVRDKNGTKAGRMAGKLGLDVPARELSSSDPRTVLQVGRRGSSSSGGGTVGLSVGRSRGYTRNNDPSRRFFSDVSSVSYVSSPISPVSRPQSPLSNPCALPLITPSRMRCSSL